MNHLLNNLIKYDKHWWLVDKIENGVAEMWFNGNCIHVPLDDLDDANISVVDKEQ